MTTETAAAATAGSSHPQPGSQSPASTFFSRAQWWVWGALLVAGVALRFALIEARPMHHDESLHAMYGRYFFDFPDHNYYRYNPMLHGPFLYNFLRLVYNTLGSSIWAVRVPMALLGSLFILLPFLYRRYLTPTSVLFLTAGVALSPTMIYWSRFIREDIPSLTSMAIILYGCTLAAPARRALFVLVGTALMFAIKENSYVTAAILLGYFIFEWGFRRIIMKEGDSLVSRMWGYVRTHPIPTIVAFGLAALLYSWLFSAGFRYSQGILDGLYRESIMYWVHHHTIERIKGPFLFHFYVLSWYELPFLVAFLTHLVLFYRRATLPFQAIAGVVLAAAAMALIHHSNPDHKVEESAVWQIFKLKDSFDVVGLFVFLVHPVLVTVYHLLRRERTLALWGYLFTATLFTYSYLGEKVPWLTIYPLSTGLIYLTLYFQDWFRTRPMPSWQAFPVERVLLWAGSILGILTLIFMYEEGFKPNLMFVVSSCVILLIAFLEGMGVTKFTGRCNLRTWAFVVIAVFNLRMAILTNFTYAGHSSEFLSQVHTTPEFHELVQRMRQEIESPLHGAKPTILGVNEVVWPITWYLVDIPQYKFSAEPSERPGFTWIFQDFKEPAENVPEGFTVQQIPLRGWWVPDYQQMTLKKFLNYAVNHRPWSDVGYTYVHLLTRRGAPNPG